MHPDLFVLRITGTPQVKHLAFPIANVWLFIFCNALVNMHVRVEEKSLLRPSPRGCGPPSSSTTKRTGQYPCPCSPMPLRLFT